MRRSIAQVYRQWQQGGCLALFGRTGLPGYNMNVEKTVSVFGNFEDADEADARHDAAMSPEERLNIVIELRDRRHPDAAQQRLARVYRVVELERS
jgi:hypothetical protein